MKNNILVTGANGFLATHLIESLLKEGSFIVSLILDKNFLSSFYKKNLHKKTQVIEGSVCDFGKLQKILAEYEIDTVFHLAAETQVQKAIEDPFTTFESNIRGSYTLFEACRRAIPKRIEKIIVASSDKAYGFSEILPYQETFPLKGVYPYDVSKSCMDLLANSYYKTYDLPISIVRSANIYGSCDYHYERLIPGTIKSLLKGVAPEIRSDGSLMRNYIYVDDIVEGYMAIANLFLEKKLGGESFNFGTSHSYTVLEVVNLITKLMNRTSLKPKVLNCSQKEILDQKVCYKKAMNVLDWSANTSFVEGLRKTIAAYQEELDCVAMNS